MSCFSFSHSERRPCSSKHKLSWSFFSSHNSAPQARTSAPETNHRALSQPSSCQESFEERQPPGTLSQSSSHGTLSESSSLGPSNIRVYSLSELRALTRNFSSSNLLGEGGFGCVYRGAIKIDDTECAQEVAVKQLNRKGQQGHKEWLAEVRFLGMVDHPNLVKLVGYCAEDDERGIQRLLVYEYMANKSLEDHLFQKGPSILTWHDRVQILLGAARGLAYLHEEIHGIQVIYRDFKTSNVLLDKDFTPKLSDFGLAREGPELGASHVSTTVVGTLGYASPEYIQTGHLTVKSDVWSFGIVLLEMLFGRRSLDRNRPKSEQQLLEWARPYLLHGGKRLHLIMDSRLGGQFSLAQAQMIASLATQCLERNPRARPAMSVVVEKLKEIAEIPEGGKPFLTMTKDSMPNAHAPKESSVVKNKRLFFNENSWFTWRVRTPKPVMV